MFLCHNSWIMSTHKLTVWKSYDSPYYRFSVDQFPIFRFTELEIPRQTNCMTRMISRDYHFRYHSAYYIVYHRFLPKTYTKFISIKGCCFCCCCFQCNFPYLIVGIRAWFAGTGKCDSEKCDSGKRDSGK
jgi:hypothetical protein